MVSEDRNFLQVSVKACGYTGASLIGAGGVKKEEYMTLKGGCACRAIGYELTADPLIVHACHCRDCQRVTGSAFVVNEHDDDDPDSGLYRRVLDAQITHAEAVA